MISLSDIQLTKIYENDYYLWLIKTLELIRNQKIEELDWEHLSEEIEALGSEQRHKVKSYLRQLLIHLLLYQYWQEERDYCGQRWQDEISNSSYELELLFESKTLYNYGIQQIDEVYTKARQKVIQKTKLSPLIFPEQCPFTLDQILKDNE